MLQLVVAALLVASQASAIIAFDTPSTTAGNQGGAPYTYGFDLGMQFTVNNPGGIRIDQLGVFDDGRDGFGGATITVAVYDMTGTALASLPFSGTSGSFISDNAPTYYSSYRFLPLTTPLVLSANSTYMIVASGLGTSANKDYNSDGGTSSLISHYTGPYVSFPTGPTSGNYYNIRTDGSPTVAFPTVHDAAGGTGPIGRYGAGTFDFTPVPEVATFGAAAVGLLGLVYGARHLRIRRKVQGA